MLDLETQWPEVLTLQGYLRAVSPVDPAARLEEVERVRAVRRRSEMPYPRKRRLKRYWNAVERKERYFCALSAQVSEMNDRWQIAAPKIENILSSSLNGFEADALLASLTYCAVNPSLTRQSVQGGPRTTKLEASWLKLPILVARTIAIEKGLRAGLQSDPDVVTPFGEILRLLWWTLPPHCRGTCEYFIVRARKLHRFEAREDLLHVSSWIGARLSREIFEQWHLANGLGESKAYCERKIIRERSSGGLWICRHVKLRKQH